MDTSNEEYIVAEGPDGLERVLEELLEKSKTDPTFALQEHYVMYQLGNQKSLIRVDTDKVPFTFWYYDLMGRPATSVVKETIARFLWDKGGLKEKYFQNTSE